MIGESLKTLKFIKHFRKYSSSEDELVRKRALLYLKELLKTEGGILTKFLQYRGTSADELEEINSLSSQKLEGIELNEINSILEKALGEKFLDIKEITDSAIAASVGQVHFAMIDHKKVAIKIQYPNIKQTFIEQLKIFKILPSALKVSPLRKWGIDLSSYQEQLQCLIDEECDYNKEAQHLCTWKSLLTPIKHVRVPDVLDQYSCKNILIQEYIEGETIDELKTSWDLADKEDIAEKLIYSYFYLLLKHGVTQGDTNHGNFLFQKGVDTHLNSVVYLDLGQVVSFSTKFHNAILYMLDCKLNKKEFCSYSFLIGIGFDPNKIVPIKERTDLIVDVLFEPLFASYSFDLNNWNYKNDLDLLLGDEKWWFRSAGGTEFFLFMKSFMGIKNLICKLNTSVFFRGILTDISTKYRSDLFKDNALVILQKPVNSGVENYKSEKIQIIVTENKREKVKMQLPFNSIFELSDFLSKEVLDTINKNDISVKQVVQDALKDGGKPKKIFSLDIETKHIEISLI